MSKRIYLGKPFTCFFYIVLFVNFSYAQIPFGKSLYADTTNNLYHRSRTMTICLDNTLLLSGDSRSSGSPNTDGFYLSKIDSSGIINWTKNYRIDSVGQIAIRSIVTLPDSSFICVGVTQTGTFLVKIDKQGNSSWVKAYNLIHKWTFIKAIYDNGFIYGVGDCIHNTFIDGSFDVKFDTLGNLLSYKSF